MSLSLVDFWKRLLQSGLADSSTPRLWAADFANDHGGTPPSDPLSLAKWLVQSGRLQPFQAACLLHGSPEHRDSSLKNPSDRFPVMRIGPLTQSAEQAPPPFEKWLPVTHQSDPDTPGIVLQIVPTRLTPAEGDRLRVIAGSAGPAVPAFQLLALPGAPLGDRTTSIPLQTTLDAVGLFAPLPPGRMLAQSGSSQPGQARWTAAEISGLLQSLGDALASYSATQPSGSLPFPPMPSPDRIWIPDDSAAAPILWLDPAEYLSEGVWDSPGTMATAESRLLYAAPETLGDPAAAGGGGSPSSLESQAVYALGCLAYRLRFGQHAFVAAKDEQIRSRQIHFEPPELTDAIAQGAAGDPLLRVLGHALAKDPASRFASLDAFMQALRAAAAVPAPVLREPPVSAPPVPAPPVPEPTVPAPTVPEPAAVRPPVPDPPDAVPEPPTAVPEAARPVPAQAEPKPGGGEGIPGTAPPAPAAPPERPQADAPAPIRSDRSIAAGRAERPASALADSTRPAEPAKRPATDRLPHTAAQATSSVPTAAVPTAAAAPTAAPRQVAPDRLAAPAAPAPVSLAASPGQDGPSGVVSVVRAEPAARTAAPRRRRRIAWYVLGSLWIPIVLLIVALALQDPNAPRPVAKRMRPPIPAVIPSVSGSRPVTPPAIPPARRPPAPARDAQPAGIEIVSDDQMLWAPPSALIDPAASAAPKMRATMLLPPGPAAIFTFDIAQLTATGLRDTFDPELAPLFEQLQDRTSVSIDDIRMVAMAWFPNREGIPEVALAVHLKSPRPLDQLVAAWDVSMAQAPGGVTLYASDEPDADAYYPHFLTPSDSAAGDDSVADASGEKLVDAFAVGSLARITDVAEVAGAAVLLPRQLEDLWQSAEPTDAVAMLTQPNFLIADARTWVDRTAPPLLAWVRSALTPECGGVLLRIVAVPPRGPASGPGPGSEPAAGSLGSYLEIRLAAAPGMDPQALKAKIHERIDHAQIAAEDFLVSREVDPSWRLLASRLPNMWNFLAEQTRAAAINREVVFNAYLPPLALPQIGLATLLASNTTALSSAAMEATAPAKPLSIEEMLDRPMSVSFGQESLQFAVDTIVTEFAADLPAGSQPPAVEIIGGDLQLMGITQNQQVRNFAQNNLPLRTVLTELVLGANPDRTASGPDDPKQTLIWVVVGQGDQAEIKITTREAAKTKNYTLPKEFQPQ